MLDGRLERRVKGVCDVSRFTPGFDEMKGARRRDVIVPCWGFTASLRQRKDRIEQGECVGIAVISF